jgi:drug/metabolite transporter (DMT)-like permease
VAAVLLGVVSGSLWGVFAVLTKGLVDHLDRGLGAILVMPELYVWAVVAVAATAWQQSSFRAGSLSASLPTMTVTEPVVASALGMGVLGETLRPSDDGWVALVIAVVVVVFATAALARSEAGSGTGTAAAQVVGTGR